MNPKKEVLWGLRVETLHATSLEGKHDAQLVRRL